MYESESCSVESNSLWPHRLYNPWNSPGQNTGVGSFSLLQGIFPTHGLNPGLLHCRQILYQLSYKGSSRILEWVTYPFSSRFSQPRNWTGVPCIAGGFFSNWAIREAWYICICHIKKKMWYMSWVELIWVEFSRSVVNPWTTAHQASLSITSSRSLLKLMSIELVIPLSTLLLLPSIFPSIRVLSNKSVLCIRWPKYWSFSFSISPSNEYSGLISFRMDWLDLLTVPWTSSPTPQFKSINSSVLGFLYSPYLTSIHDYWKNCSFD